MSRCTTCVDAKNKLFCSKCVVEIRRKKQETEKAVNDFVSTHKYRIYPNYDGRVNQLTISRRVR